MLSNNCYAGDYCTFVLFNGYFGNLRRYSHVILNGGIYTISSFRDIFKGCQNVGAERANARCPLPILVTDWDRLASAPKKRNPLMTGHVFNSGGKMGLRRWAHVPGKYAFHRFLHFH